MINPFLAGMNKRSTKDLKQVIAESQKYTAEAIEAALVVLKERQVEVDLPIVATQPLSEQKAVRKKKGFRFLRHYVRFILHPDVHAIEAGLIGKTMIALRFYAVSILLYLPLVYLLPLLAKIPGVSFPTSKPIFPGESLNQLDLIMFVMVMPPLVGLVEEFAFRLFLDRFNKKYAYISLSMICSYFIINTFAMLLYPDYFEGTGITGQLLFTFIMLGAFSAIIYIALSNSPTVTKFLENIWETDFKKVFYLSAIIFAVSHLRNYDWEPQSFILLPVVLFPYFNYAFLFSLLRIRLGIVYAISIHALVDLIAVLIFVSKMS
ncbi:CPBP family glutamic-type intramembrane protease [Imperialibacter roseus]|uniref:CPBP family glutamic-type intramembrane protease n=1 Tax=Imperialibacter roseus TaxID=1324217 RepID=A0ABZ0IGS8_9BACT|nr:CPBP family glutamic-type intramembrane protease [Imperialibacter roseus]WOK04245.1 CPBP family glutamic-type intramembrane protease [Imperialibacter roseus]